MSWCPDCDNRISDRSNTCPHCGFDMKSHMKEVKRKHYEGLARKEKREKQERVTAKAQKNFRLQNEKAQRKAAADKAEERKFWKWKNMSLFEKFIIISVIIFMVSKCS